jgi:acetyl-CoA synthetase
MRRILRKIIAGEGDQLGDLSSVAEPSVVEDSECNLSHTDSPR